MARKYTDSYKMSYTVTKAEFIKKNLKKLTDYDLDYLHLILVTKQNEAREIIENDYGFYSDKTVNEYKRHIESIDRILSSFDCPSTIEAWEL